MFNVWLKIYDYSYIVIPASPLLVISNPLCG